MSALGEDWDLVVIGGGAAGLAAARAGASLGARVLLVSEGPLGGECTFTGCVPSKALIEAAARGLGFEAAMARVRHGVERIAATEDEGVLEREGVAVLRARARFVRPGLLDAEGRSLPARRVVLATGALPAVPSLPGLDGVGFLTTETVFDLRRPPRTLAVLGGGASGCELAQAFARLGARVVLVELRERLLAAEEPEASDCVAQALTDDGVKLLLGCRLERVEALGADGQVRLLHRPGEPVDVERLLVTAGRRAATDDLGLETGGIAVDERGSVRTDARLATTARGVWAAGDVTGRLPFTHAADEMGRIAAENALARRGRRTFRSAAVPWVTFTDPEVARVGLTEAQAASQEARVAYLPLAEVDRAVVAGAERGFVKLVAGPRRLVGNRGGGRLLGATVVAERGGELIHEAALAMRTGMFAGRLAQTVHAYPTWSVAMRQAAAQLVTEYRGRTARAARRTPESSPGDDDRG